MVEVIQVLLMVMSRLACRRVTGLVNWRLRQELSLGGLEQK